ncbi:hypothetical protein OGM63_08165 [Plectonema radiosum NIES-515]|uniref:Uncharacterized protein n=1 Tax=Plectonema radiosum NIES-515 TaxID=2986073 RepID=A0ABT3AWJ7_9CYAN|nr:hypothetical protein [Plectonema radiosum]MCV3213499.1 hypothetical protein [Plectonema radiosum NIES-515]
MTKNTIKAMLSPTAKKIAYSTLRLKNPTAAIAPTPRMIMPMYCQCIANYQQSKDLFQMTVLVAEFCLCSRDF